MLLVVILCSIRTHGPTIFGLPPKFVDKSMFGDTSEPAASQAAFAANWAKEISEKSVAVTALGADEIAWHKGHNYLTLTYQIDSEARRLLLRAPGVVAGSRRCCGPLALSRAPGVV